MSAIWMRLRTELRAGWRALVSLALIVGVAAGCAIAAAAGARRTESAYPRFLRAYDAFHAMTGGGAEENFERRFAALPRMPEVDRALPIVIAGAEVTVPARRGRPEHRLGIPELFLVGEPTGRALYTTNRAKILSGRLPDKEAADETVAPFSVAERVGLRTGDTVVAGVGFDEEFRPVTHTTLRVVGIVAAPGDFRAVGQTTFNSLYVTPAFLERYRNLIPPPSPDMWSFGVHLKGGPTAAPAFKQTVERTLDFDVPFIEPVLRAGVQKTMRLYALALWLLAALVAVATIAIFGQTLARQLVLESAEYPSLRSLGMGRRQLAALGLARAALVGLAGVAIAVTTAFLLSPLTPIGEARVAEPDPGFAFDAASIGIGAAALITVVILLSIIPSLRAARLASVVRSGSGAASVRVSRIVSGAARLWSSPSGVSGLRMALEPGRGRTSVPVRSTIAAVAVGVAAVTASLVAGQSLHNLIRTPALSGFTYDAIVLNEREASEDETVRVLRQRSFVEQVSSGTGLNVAIGGVDSFVVSVEADRPIGFAVIEGRPPGDRLRPVIAGEPPLPEVALGPATMRRLGLAIGDVVEIEHSVHVDEEDRRAVQRALVVGRAAIPPLPWAATSPGEGAVMSLGAVRSFAADEGGCCFVRFVAGADLDDARAELERDGYQVFMRTQRADLATLERIAGLPTLLSALFAVIAVAALAHVLVSGIRRRRRDLAILKTLGFVTGQVRATVAWQATTIAVLCVAVGIPAGVAFGRWGWNAIADQFGVVPAPVAPLLTIGLAIPIAIALANVVAALPARAAARTQPAIVLRSE